MSSLENAAPCALGSAFYDITRAGWDIVASPRHADVITVTGPMTEAMRPASHATIEAASQPCIVLGIGDCASGRGPWAGAASAGAGAAIESSAAIEVPGCPPTPDAIRMGLRAAAEWLSHAAPAILSASGRSALKDGRKKP